MLNITKKKTFSNVKTLQEACDIVNKYNESIDLPEILSRYKA